MEKEIKGLLTDKTFVEILKGNEKIRKLAEKVFGADMLNISLGGTPSGKLSTIKTDG